MLLEFKSNNNNLLPAKVSLSGPPLHCLGMSRHFELMYNMGIQLLHCGKALPAFECLIEAVQMFQINPHLWLRLAECCMMAYREVFAPSLLITKVIELYVIHLT